MIVVIDVVVNQKTLLSLFWFIENNSLKLTMNINSAQTQ